MYTPSIMHQDRSKRPVPFFNDAHDKYGVNASYKSRISLD
jgi:hypothetical protein